MEVIIYIVLFLVNFVVIPVVEIGSVASGKIRTKSKFALLSLLTIGAAAAIDVLLGGLLNATLNDWKWVLLITLVAPVFAVYGWIISTCTGFAFIGKMDKEKAVDDKSSCF